MQTLLELITTREKAEAMLESPIIEAIFTVLVVMFVVTFIVHFVLYTKLKRIRNYVRDTNRMDIAPLQSFQEDFQKAQEHESIKPETFVQTKFSAWRIFQIPVVSLLKIVQMTVSVFILLGVLGTFIGLTISLGSIDAADEQLVENVAAVLNGIDVAFYTSIVGMSFSLIMTVVLKLFNTEYMLTDLMLNVETLLEEEEQAGMGKLIQVSGGIQQAIESLEKSNQASLTNMEQAFSGFQDYTDNLGQAAADLATFNDGLAENLTDFHELFNHMKQVTDGFGESTNELNQNFASLFSYFKRIDQKNERMANAFEQTHEKMKVAIDSQTGAMNHVETSMETLQTFTSELLNEQKELHSAYSNIQRETKALAENMQSHNQTFQHIFGDDLSAKLTGMISSIRELTSGFDKIGESIGGLPQALEVINETQAEYKHLLRDRFDELKDFNQTFHQHLKDHASESDAFIRHVGEASKTYEQLGRQNNELLNDVNRTIQQIDQTFQKQDNQLEKGVDVLKDTLSAYVTNLEGSLKDSLEKIEDKLGDSVGTLEGKLGDELRQVAREMNEAATQTSDALVRQWRELEQELTSQHTQSTREQQNLFNALTNEIHALNNRLDTLQRQSNSMLKGPENNEY